MTSLASFQPLPEGRDQFTLPFMETRRALVLAVRDEVRVIGVVDPDDVLLQEELRDHLQCPLEFHQIGAHELAEYLGGVLSQGAPRPESRGPEKMRLDELANDAPIVNLANTLLMEGLRRGCSDIHIESLPLQSRVRYRIDGVMETGRVLSRDVMPGLSSRIKIMANLDIIERRLPQDGRLSVDLGSETVEFRVSVVPLADGESIVLRVFQKQGGIPALGDLGFSPRYRDTLQQAARSSHGLILMTGPTGSGKTTTLNSLLSEISSPEIKVITIEDPVENVLDGVNQIQTNESIGLGFDTLLRRLLRQDPDVLMVGEVRDKTTADLTVRAALTGHLVLSTLHTNDALSSIARLTDMGVEPFLLGSVLRAVAAQRLVRALCPRCRTAVLPSEREALRLQSLGTPLGRLFVAKGCEACHGTGYVGRTVVAEIFPIDDGAEELILSRARRADLEGHYRSSGHPFLWDDAARLLREGRTSLAEVERAVLTR